MVQMSDAQYYQDIKEAEQNGYNRGLNDGKILGAVDMGRRFTSAIQRMEQELHFIEEQMHKQAEELTRLINAEINRINGTAVELPEDKIPKRRMICQGYWGCSEDCSHLKEHDEDQSCSNECCGPEQHCRPVVELTVVPLNENPQKEQG